MSAGTSTIYDVGLRFTLDDKTGAGISLLAEKVDRLEKRLSTTQTAVHDLGSIIVDGGSTGRGLDVLTAKARKLATEAQKTAHDVSVIAPSRGKVDVNYADLLGVNTKAHAEMGIMQAKVAKAADGTREFTREAQVAEMQTSAWHHSLIAVGAVAAAGFGLHEGKKYLVEWNAEMETLKIGLGAMLQGNQITFGAESTGHAVDVLAAKFQKFAVQTPVTTRELVQFSGGIATAVAQAKGGVQDIENVTEQGVIAAKAFGANADYAALEITEGIMGAATKRMRFIRQLVATAGMDLEQFNHLKGGDAERLKVIQEALNSPAMKDAATKYGRSFTGVTSTLQDNIEIGLGKVGLPIFTAITTEIGRWNAYIDQNRFAIDQWGQSVGRNLVTGFTAVKDALAWILEHRTALATVGGGLLLSKMGGGAMGFGGGGGLGSPLAERSGMWAAVLRRQYGVADERSRFGTLRGNLGMIGAAAGGGRGLLASELRTMSAVGGPSMGDIVGRGALGFGLAKAVGADDLGASISAASFALGALPGPLGALGTAVGLLTIGMKAAADWWENRKKTARDADQAHFEARRNGSEITGEMTEFEKLRHRAKLNADDIAVNGDRSGVGLALLKNQDARMGSIAAVVHEQTQGAFEYASRYGAINEKGKLDADRLRGEIRPVIGTPEEFQKVELVVAAIAAALDARARTTGALDARDNKIRTEEEERQRREMLNRAKIDVRIDRIEVASDDPDRFAFGLVRALEAVADNPTQAGNALRAGL